MHRSYGFQYCDIPMCPCPEVRTFKWRGGKHQLSGRGVEKQLGAPQAWCVGDVHLMDARVVHPKQRVLLSMYRLACVGTRRHGRPAAGVVCAMRHAVRHAVVACPENPPVDIYNDAPHSKLLAGSTTGEDHSHAHHALIKSRSHRVTRSIRTRMREHIVSKSELMPLRYRCMSLPPRGSRPVSNG